MHYLESKLGLELILKYSAGLDHTPKHVDALKSHHDLAVAQQQLHWSCTTRIFPSLLVIPTEEWQLDNVQLSVVTGD